MLAIVGRHATAIRSSPSDTGVPLEYAECHRRRTSYYVPKVLYLCTERDTDGSDTRVASAMEIQQHGCEIGKREELVELCLFAVWILTKVPICIAFWLCPISMFTEMIHKHD